MVMISLFICLNFMILPKALNSFTISDLSFINVERGSIIASHSNPSFQSASSQTALSKNVDKWQKEESSKWMTYGYYVMNFEAWSITPSHCKHDMSWTNQEESISTKSKSSNPSFPTPSSLLSSFINDRVFSLYADDMMKCIVFWLLAVLSMNYSIKIDKVMTNILMLFMVITFMTDVRAEMQMTKLLANDVGGDGGFFGYSVSNYDETVIIGAPYAYNDNGLRAGAAYIFKMSSSNNNEAEWSQSSKLSASDGEISDFFGLTVSIYGEFAVVGAVSHNNYAGAVYVYQRQENDSWTQQSKLTASDDVSMYFGHDVSIYDKWIAVAARYDDDYEASVYMFEYDESDNNWTETQKLKARVPSSDTYFGSSIAVYNNTVIIGSSEEWCIFERDDDGFWNQTYYEIEKVDDVAMYKDLAVIGDQLNEAVYIHTKKNGIWSKSQTLRASDSQNGYTFFGSSVSIYDDIVVIGAFLDDNKADRAGAIYIFSRQSNDSWIESTKIVANDGEANGWFGYTTSIHNDIIVIGAKVDGDQDQGAVYIIKNWDSCYSIWNETKNEEILLNDTNTTYLIDYERSLCNFAQFTKYPTMVPTDAHTKDPTTKPTIPPTDVPTSNVNEGEESEEDESQEDESDDDDDSDD